MCKSSPDNLAELHMRDLALSVSLRVLNPPNEGRLYETYSRCNFCCRTWNHESRLKCSLNQRCGSTPKQKPSRVINDTCTSCSKHTSRIVAVPARTSVTPLFWDGDRNTFSDIWAANDGSLAKGSWPAW